MNWKIDKDFEQYDKLGVVRYSDVDVKENKPTAVFKLKSKRIEIWGKPKLSVEQLKWIVDKGEELFK